MGVAAHGLLDQLRLEALANLFGTVAARAHKAHAAIGQRFDHRHADMLGGAMVAGFGLGHRQMDGATHERDSVAERMIMGRNPAGKRER